jgi:methylase of polypeptide subunit release factors
MLKLATGKNQKKDFGDPVSQLILKRAKSWDMLLASVGLESSLAQNSIRTIAEAFDEDGSNEGWYSLWREHCSNYFDLDEADRLLERHLIPGKQRKLFFLQAYCKLLLEKLLEQNGLSVEGVSRPGFFNWLDIIDFRSTGLVRQEIASIVDLADVSHGSPQELSNFLSFMYQEIFPPALRHLTGEYYTPSWLIDHTLSSVESLSNDKPEVILDPAAGSGGFLVHYIERTSDDVRPAKIIAADINPLAIEFCQANLAVAKRRQASRKIETVVLIADTIFDSIVDRSTGPLFGASKDPERTIFGETFTPNKDWSEKIHAICKKFRIKEGIARSKFTESLKRYLADGFSSIDSLKADLIIGNPPWMTWDALQREYRDKLAMQWASSSLVTQKGWRAKVAAGKTDLSTLFVYRAAERHAASRAKMAFVLPLSLFQSRHAGAGFRKFRSTDGREYALLSLSDFSAVKVFGDAANRTAVATFEVDKNPFYPVPYIEWANEGDGKIAGERKVCQPIDKDDPSSPIVAFTSGDTGALAGIGKSQYLARGGVNTGGANTILWLDILEVKQSLLRVQNVGVTKKARSEVRGGWVEADAVHPMIIGLDVVRWRAQPSKHLLLLYSPDSPKKAMEETAVRAKFPNAYNFACQFKDELLARKEYHRWGGVGPFYEVYRIGPYTFSPIKVVWQHTGFRGRLRVAVIDDRNRPITIPDQKVILIPSTDIAEAHYICAFLSSAFVSNTLQRYLGTDASTHILDYIGLKLYSPENALHRELATLSQAAHAAAILGNPTETFENKIDRIVEEMRGKI